MPIQAPQWTEFLSCPVCYNVFNETHYRPISLACGHTVCKSCLLKFQQRKCPFDQSVITRSVEDLPANFALLQLVSSTAKPDVKKGCVPEDVKKYYEHSKTCVEELALLLKPVSSTTTGSIISVPTCGPGSQTPTCVLSRPMQRKLITLVNCQLVEEEGQARALRAARSLGERTVTELILQHQNPQQLSSNLWAAVRGRGCQFLGPGMQEEVLKLILLALEDGSALSRKVLVLFVVQRLEAQYPQASKTAIGHVVQLLYRASCFKVTKRDEESSLMQLKEEYRSYDMLRREHDSQIVQIAMEAGLRIAPDQWSSLLYGDSTHKSHMQSIIDKLQTPQTFSQSVNELVIALQRTNDPHHLQRLQPELEFLASIDPSPDVPPPSWEYLDGVMKAVKTAVEGLVHFLQNSGIRRHDFLTPFNSRYKTSMCRDYQERGHCPRANNCTFAHSEEELDKYRQRNKRASKGFILHRLDQDDEEDPRTGGDRPDLLMDMKNLSQIPQKKGSYPHIMGTPPRPPVTPGFNRQGQPTMGTVPTLPPPMHETLPVQPTVMPAAVAGTAHIPQAVVQPGVIQQGTIQPGIVQSGTIQQGTIQQGTILQQGPSDIIMTPQGLVQTASGLAMQAPQMIQQPQQQVQGYAQASVQTQSAFVQQQVQQQSTMVVDQATAVALQVNGDSAIVQAGNVIPQPGQMVVQQQAPMVNTVPAAGTAQGQVQVQNQQMNPPMMQAVAGVNQEGSQMSQPGVPPGQQGMMNTYMTPYGPAGSGMMGPRFPMHHPMMYPYPPMPPYMAYYHQGFYPPDNTRMPYDKYYTALNPFAEPWNPSYGGQYPDSFRNMGEETCAMCNHKQAEQRQQQQKQQQQHQYHNHGHSRMCQHASHDSRPANLQFQNDESLDKSSHSPSQSQSQQKPQQQQQQPAQPQQSQQQQQYPPPQQQQTLKSKPQNTENEENSSYLKQNPQQLPQHKTNYQQTGLQNKKQIGSQAQYTSQQQKQYSSYTNTNDDEGDYDQDSTKSSNKFQLQQQQQNQPPLQQQKQRQQQSHKQQISEQYENQYNQYSKQQQYPRGNGTDSPTTSSSQYKTQKQQKYQQQQKTADATSGGNVYSKWHCDQDDDDDDSYRRDDDDDGSNDVIDDTSQLQSSSSSKAHNLEDGDDKQQHFTSKNSGKELQCDHASHLRRIKEVPLLPVVDEPNAQLHRQSLDNLKERREKILAKLQEISKESIPVSKIESHLDELPPLFKYVHLDVKESGAYRSTLKHPSPMDTGPVSLKDHLPSNGEIFERLGAISGFPPRSVNDSIMTSWATSALNSQTKPKNPPEWSAESDQTRNKSPICDPYKLETATKQTKHDSTVQSKEKMTEWKCDENNFPYWKDITENLDSPITTPPSTPQPVKTSNGSRPQASNTSFSDSYRGKTSSINSQSSISSQSFPTSVAKVSNAMYHTSSVMTSTAPTYSASHLAYDSDYLYTNSSYTSVTKPDDEYNRTVNPSWSYGMDESNSYPPTSYRLYTSEYDTTCKPSTSVYSSLASYTTPSSYWTTTSYSGKSIESTASTSYAGYVFEEDHIPFIEGSPTISKFGPISRISKSSKIDSVKVMADEMAKTAPVTAVTPINGPPLPSSEMVPSRFSLDGTILKGTSNLAEPVVLAQEAYKVYSLWTNEVNFLEMKAKEANTEDEKLCVKLQAVELQISMKEQLLEQAQTAGRRQVLSSEYMKRRQQENHCDDKSFE